MHRKYILYGIVLTAMCACTSVNDTETGARVSMRMQAEATAPTDFQSGDRIGVSAREYNVPLCTNRAWTYTDGQFIGTDTLAVERGAELRLSAYYPYEATLDSVTPMLTIDVRQPGYTDYLWATDTLTMNSRDMQANLQFRHVLTRIECVFHPSAEFPAGEKLSMTLSGVLAKVEKDVQTGAETLSGEATIALSGLPEQAIQVLLPAQTTCPTISFSYAGKSFQAIPIATQTYLPGRSYRYDIAFGSDVDPTITQVQISDQSTNFQLLPRR